MLSWVELGMADCTPGLEILEHPLTGIIGGGKEPPWHSHRDNWKSIVECHKVFTKIRADSEYSFAIQRTDFGVEYMPEKKGVHIA
jgi:hypothetical protein